jgi:hypothetical protein
MLFMLTYGVKSRSCLGPTPDQRWDISDIQGMAYAAHGPSTAQTRRLKYESNGIL